MAREPQHPVRPGMPAARSIATGSGWPVGRVGKGQVMARGMGDHVGDALRSAKDKAEEAIGAGDEPREAAMHRERLGRTNAERDHAADPAPATGKWDWAGDDGEGLDELQGRFDASATRPDAAMEEVARSDPPRGEPQSPVGSGSTPDALWDRLAGLGGRTLQTAKGERFEVATLERGVGLTVIPLDGGQRWTVGPGEIGEALRLVEDGMSLDRVAPVRLRAAGVAAHHPEYVVAIVRALAGEG